MPFLVILFFVIALTLVYINLHDEEHPRISGTHPPQEHIIPHTPSSSPGGAESPQDYGRLPLRVRRRKPDEDLTVHDLLIQSSILEHDPNALDLWDIVPEELLNIQAFDPVQPPLVVTTTPPTDREAQETREPSPQPVLHQEPLAASKDTSLVETQDTGTQTQPLPERQDMSIGTEESNREESWAQTSLSSTMQDKGIATDTLTQDDAATQTQIMTHDQGTGSAQPFNLRTLKAITLEPLHIGPFEEEEDMDLAAFLKHHAPPPHKAFDVHDVESILSEYVSVPSNFLHESQNSSLVESIVLEDMPKVLPLKPALNLFETPTAMDKDQPSPQALIMSFRSWNDKDLEDQEDSWQKVLGSPNLKPHSLMSLSFEIMEKEEDKPLVPPPAFVFKKKEIIEDLSFEKIE